MFALQEAQSTAELRVGGEHPEGGNGNFGPKEDQASSSAAMGS